MRLGKCTAQNFGSYKELEIDFSDTGLCLIYGTTGSGKSTLPDLAAWALYGVTAKDGNADEVKSWKDDGRPTSVSQGVETSEGTIYVTRVRGKASENDLFWTEHGSVSECFRGKDLVDTQKLLNNRLGVDSSEYLTGAYFHEFSPTASFFTATARYRRAVFESVCDLQLPVRISTGASDRRKEVKGALTETQTAFDKETGRVIELRRIKREAETSRDGFVADQHAVIGHLQKALCAFEEEKAVEIEIRETRAARWRAQQAKLIEKRCDEAEALEKEIEENTVLEAACPTCGTPSAKRHKADMARVTLKGVLDQIKSLQEQVNPNDALLEAAKGMENKYAEQLETEKMRRNPHLISATRAEQNLANSEEMLATLTERLKTLQHEYGALNRIYDLSYDLRGELLKNAVRRIQDSTNKYLETYFDAEIRVSFTLEGADSLAVSIQKSGYECSYKQLSRGQRALLRLSFVVSVMSAASDKAGTHFDNLFFDEVLDGLDAGLKVKAFGLFEELAGKHGSVMLIDHAPEFQNLFDKRYHVELSGDESRIEEE